MVTRRRLLELAGASLLLPGCAKDPTAVRIASSDTSENATIAEIYALTLERAKIPIERYESLGNAQALISAIQLGKIDVFPGYIQTRSGAWQPMPSSVGASLNGASRSTYERRYGVTWLTPSPVNVSQSFATSEYIAESYWLLTLSECKKIAPQLRLAATADFLASGGALDRLERFYGGFKFKSVLKTAPGEQYDSLNRGDADIANAFTTDPEIAENRLIILRDDQHFWSRYSLAPVIRLASLRTHPRLSSILNRISGTLSTRAIQQITMNLALLNMEPSDEARYFLDTHRKRVFL